MSITSCLFFSLFCCTFVVAVVDDDFSFWTVVVAVVPILMFCFAVFLVFVFGFVF